MAPSNMTNDIVEVSSKYINCTTIHDDTSQPANDHTSVNNENHSTTSGEFGQDDTWKPLSQL